MILWIGQCKNNIAIRCLGSDGKTSRCLRMLNPLSMPSTILRHNEGTTDDDGTSPTIGTGEAKQCRDYGIAGLSVGSTVGQPDIEPVTLDNTNCCTMAYDIESEFGGPDKPSYRSAILCVSLSCTCGYKHVISRCSLLGSTYDYTVKSNNESMAIEVMRLICAHKPVFTVGHNIYVFDNPLLAKALPRNHKYRSYFEPIQKSDNKASTTIGLIMVIPGINNIDTYKYIYHSMYHRFSSFSLEYLCRTLELPIGKMDRGIMKFCQDWYSSSFANSLKMTQYNMMDCDATLSLCNKLDMINQIVALCYGARAWIRDVALYNTGAMSLSSMCSVAWNHGYRYNWTRCDWIPDVFTGGQVLFTGNKVRRDVAIVDFTSMYPSIIRDGGISPECIDFIDYDNRNTCRFDQMTCLCSYRYEPGLRILRVGSVVLGTNNVSHNNVGALLVAEHYNMHLCTRENVHATLLCITDSLVKKTKECDSTLEYLSVETLIKWHHKHVEYSKTLEWYFQRCSQLHNIPKIIGEEGTYTFSPASIKWGDGKVDWVVGPLDTTMIFVTDSYIARFCPGPRICAEACETLMESRRFYKKLVKRTTDLTRKAVYNRTQYALKISANSMYGVMSFRHYNSYSPRCGTSVTGCGRWSLNVSAAIVNGLGFELVYGDTDSVMYTLNWNSGEKSLTNLYATHILNSHVDASKTNVMEFICGNVRSLGCTDPHLLPISNIVVKILNKIMSYTCLTRLSVEQQETDSTMPVEYKSLVFPSFMITSKKHYVGMRRDGQLYTKGMNYIRRSGSMLSSVATQEFVKIALSNEGINVIKLNLSRTCSELKWKISCGKYPQLLNINMKYMGKRANYIRVAPVTGGQYKYVESHVVPGVYTIDSNYYMNKIRTSLVLVTNALGIDVDLIYSGVLLTY